jgi:hypothetical protein
MVARLKLKGIDGRAPPGVNKNEKGSAPKSVIYSTSHFAFILFLLLIIII